jgi:calcineurin-like phosphoesterase family protein
MKITLETGQKLWFTSDTHYGHTNICRGVSNWKDFNGNVPIKQTRDFKTLNHMNDVIVESINSVVGENDILFHLGDWSFGGFENIAEFRNRIVCKNIHLVLGNHDHHIESNKQLTNFYKDLDTLEIMKGNIEDHYSEEYKFGEYWNNKVYVQDLFSSVNQYLRLSVSGYEFVLMHYPIASWHNMNTGVIHLHGHVHLPRNKKLAQGKAMDVGVDGNGLMPYSLNEITRIMDKQPIAKLSLPQDHHEEKLSGNGGNKKGSSSF